jgi:hypothetical protein
LVRRFAGQKRAVSRWVDWEEPRAMGELVLRVQFGVVARPGLPHFPQDLQPALADAAQGIGLLGGG